MITCPKCSKDNQDHYKFCLGCGAELPRENAPKPFSPQTPPHGVPAAQAASPAAAPAPAAGPSPAPAAGPAAAAPVPAAAPNPAATQESLGAPAAVPGPSAPPAAAGASAACPQCGHQNAVGNRFCASCGYNLAALGSQMAGSQMAGSQAPAAAPAAPPEKAGKSSVVLTALRADGSEAGEYSLPESPTVTVGRDTGSIFAGDSYLSPKHASFTRQGGQLHVKDAGSLNGVYIKLVPNRPWRLEFNDVLRIGQEIVRLEALKPGPPASDGVQRFGSPTAGYIGRLALVIGRDTTGNAFPIPERGVHLGRERGDILFSEDGYVSGLHCRIAPEPDGNIYLTDVGSSNGTFVRLSREHALVNGDTLLMGQQLFRVDLQ